MLRSVSTVRLEWETVSILGAEPHFGQAFSNSPTAMRKDTWNLLSTAVLGVFSDSFLKFFLS